MRLKKHLDERIAEAQSVLLAREGDEWYKLTESEKLQFALPLESIFGTERCHNPLTLEIGCGKGAWATQSALLHPDVNYIGVEKLSNVIVVACEQAQEHNLLNLKFLNVRAENLSYHLPPHSVDTIALNFSCPFPKKTYANRRLTSKNFLAMYKGLLKPEGVICQKTDDLNFFQWSIDSFTENGYEVYDICYDLPANAEGNVITEYEAKFRELGKPIYALKATLHR
ncbi:MAG: tRNA (guanosine(46)-N7)-methyltransferase TrmB [Clostridiales bacterium]|nr:tRNA (guanosine(46)-N7)-methyltransferase TrmB [Clostridiales bacterium]